MIWMRAAALEAQKAAQQAMHNQSGELDYSRAAVQLAEAAAQLRTPRPSVKSWANKLIQ